jgi:hypothetical protein
MTNPKEKANKYQPLGDYLRKCNASTVSLTLPQIEKILGFSLPKSSSINSWWSNTPENGHYQARAWTDSGFRVTVEGSKRVFIRQNGPKKAA